jgi:hypothetical protein
MRMRRIRAQRRRAGVPAEVMQLVAGVGHRSRRNDLRVRAGIRVDVDHRDRIRRFALGIEGGDVGHRFRRRLQGHARGRIKTGIGCPSRHVSPSWLVSIEKQSRAVCRHLCGMARHLQQPAAGAISGRGLPAATLIHQQSDVHRAYS